MRAMDKRIENEESQKFIRKTFEKEFSAQERLLEDTVKAMDHLEEDTDFKKGIANYLGLSAYALFLKGL